MDYFLNSNYLLNNLDGNDLLVLLFSNSLINTRYSESVIFIDDLYYRIYGDTVFCKNKKTIIRKSLDRVFSEDFIPYTYKDKNKVIINNSVLSFKGDNFIRITDEEINKMLKYPSGLLLYYAHIVSTINNKTNIGFTSVDSFANKIKMSKETIIEYNTILENEKVLYIKHGKCNVYGRFSDRKLVEDYYNSYTTDHTTRTLSQNEARSISKQYNDYCKGRFHGDVEQLKARCIMYNKYYSSNYKGAKLKDLSVFK